jgi:hypothetical protein
VSVGSTWLLIVGDLAGLEGSADRFATALYSDPSWTCTAGPFEYTVAGGWTIPGTAQWTIPGDVVWTVPGDAVWTVPGVGLWTIPGEAVWTLAGVAVWTIPGDAVWTVPGDAVWTVPGDAVWTVPGDVIWTRPKFSVAWFCAACILPWPRPCSRSLGITVLKRYSREIEAVNIISDISLKGSCSKSEKKIFCLAHRERYCNYPLVFCLIFQLMARTHEVTEKSNNKIDFIFP